MPQGFSCLADDTGRHMCWSKLSRQTFRTPPECGINPCAACTAGCSQSDTCEEGAWTCVCDCSVSDLETEEDGAISDEDAANEAKTEPLDESAMTDPDSDVDTSSAMEVDTTANTPGGIRLPKSMRVSSVMVQVMIGSSRRSASLREPGG